MGTRVPKLSKNSQNFACFIEAGDEKKSFIYRHLYRDTSVGAEIKF
ncbi:hypothetical protein FOLKNPGA_01203 [Legionella sp. PC1000]|nr:hypothetical protein FOLKNPGA_01203 [Legionella sp. PC1000]